MLPVETAAELKQMFIRQKEILLKQIARIQETVNDMSKIIDEIKPDSEIENITINRDGFITGFLDLMLLLSI